MYVGVTDMSGVPPPNILVLVDVLVRVVVLEVVSLVVDVLMDEVEAEIEVEVVGFVVGEVVVELEVADVDVDAVPVRKFAYREAAPEMVAVVEAAYWSA